MKSIVETIRESLIVEKHNSTEIRNFWRWIEDLGGTDAIDVINNSTDSDYDEFYKLVQGTGVTEDEFEIYVEIFQELSDQIREIIEDDEDNGMSDDKCQYASWSAPFYGKKRFEQALKNKEWNDICIASEGEHCGYVMDEDNYENWLEKNKK